MEFGYAGKILRIDLSTGSVAEVPTAEYAKRFLGGRGIAAKIYWDEVPPGVKALAPENKLIFVTGPLAGFPGLAGSRWQICGKSPATSPDSPEFFSYASLAGRFGAELKFAGYDGLIIQGSSANPVYLFIHDGVVETRDASFLWGKGTTETRQILKERLGRDVRVAATGPAGENLVTTAIVFAEDDASGSSGFGAVMGSKKLKAIAVKGSARVKAANPEKLEEVRKYIRHLRKDAPTIHACGFTTPFSEELQRPGNPKVRKAACYGCISGCARIVYEAEKGDKGKFMCMSLFYYPRAERYYGKWNDVPFHASRLCDEYGIDVVAIDMITTWLARCHRAGVLTDEDTGIPMSKIGSLEFIETLVKKISLREGFGDTLAQGIFKAAALVGGKAKEQLTDYIDKFGQNYYYRPGLYITTGLIYLTEPRPPIQQLHELVNPLNQWIDWCNKVEGAYVSGEVIRGIAKRFWGGEIAADFSTYEGKALAAKRIQDREYAKECLILCDFSWPILSVRHSEDHIGDPSIESKILSAVIGEQISEDELYRVGERVFNLQRAILIREGHKGREHDSLPEWDYTMPVRSFINPESIMPGEGGEIISRKGAVVDREKFEEVKEEYYRLRGWDVASGLQGREKLEELGLQDIAEELGARGLVTQSQISP